jgi:hypothetical protein
VVLRDLVTQRARSAEPIGVAGGKQHFAGGSSSSNNNSGNVSAGEIGAAAMYIHRKYCDPSQHGVGNMLVMQYCSLRFDDMRLKPVSEREYLQRKAPRGPPLVDGGSSYGTNNSAAGAIVSPDPISAALAAAPSAPLDVAPMRMHGKFVCYQLLAGAAGRSMPTPLLPLVVQQQQQKLILQPHQSAQHHVSSQSELLPHSGGSSSNSSSGSSGHSVVGIDCSNRTGSFCSLVGSSNGRNFVLAPLVCAPSADAGTNNRQPQLVVNDRN